MEILLQQKEVMDMNRLPGHLSLKCLSGQLWVTCQGSAQDTILEPGMSYHSDRKGKVVVMALAEARFCIINEKTQRQTIPFGTLLQT